MHKVTLGVHFTGGDASTATNAPTLGLDNALSTANAAYMPDAIILLGKHSAEAAGVEQSLRESGASHGLLKGEALDGWDTAGSSHAHSIVVGTANALSQPQGEGQNSGAPLGGEHRHIML